MEKITITVPTVPKLSIKTPGSGSGGTTDHSQLTNLEFENSGHTGFQGKLTDEQLANIEAVPDISKKVDETAERLTEQAGNTYTKTEVNELISRIPKMSFEVWGETLDELLALTEEEISETTIYLVSKESGAHNIYAEYIYINGVWEKLGDLDVDLTGYATKEEVEAITPRNEDQGAGSVILASNTHMVIGWLDDFPIEGEFYLIIDGQTLKNRGDGCSVYIKPVDAPLAVMVFEDITYATYFGDDCDESGTFTPQPNTHYEIHYKVVDVVNNTPYIIARVGAWQ